MGTKREGEWGRRGSGKGFGPKRTPWIHHMRRYISSASREICYPKTVSQQSTFRRYTAKSIITNFDFFIF